MGMPHDGEPPARAREAGGHELDAVMEYDAPGVQLRRIGSDGRIRVY